MRTLLLFLFLLQQLQVSAQADTVFANFSGQQAGDEVVIYFTVRGGIQCTDVRLERSTDQQNFQVIYELPGVCGNPTKDESYILTDNSPAANTSNYYRLEMGSLGIYSAIIDVDFFKFTSGEIIIQPNPCTQCNIYFPNRRREICSISLYDYHGRKILQSTISDETYQLSSISSSGVYLIEIRYPDGGVRRGRVVVQ
ncbi:MAG: T9SS type A sorting domain-containing protein [Bacteroidia bacterium]|nr:T9SS type A sorting domain-containing protein [Bacteroidia bacterium]